MMAFRAFQNDDEEQLAVELIGKIDQGEKWIFQGAKGSEEFGGFIDRLFYRNGDTYGTYSACIFDGKLRFDLGFHPDMPDDAQEELLSLIVKARGQINTFTAIWYPPENKKLDSFLFGKLPWSAKGHKTHELMFKRSLHDGAALVLPQGVSIIPFEEKYLEAACTLLDKSLAHTFGDPEAAYFSKQSEAHWKDWNEKAKENDCSIMLERGDVVGVYVLKGAEIDLMAISTACQGRGLGRYLLHHAKSHIFATRAEDPYLYCIDRNPDALRFYLREGMQITGYSGYAFLEAI